MRTVVRAQPVDIEADINLPRQRCNDPVAYRAPRLTFELRRRQLVVGELHHPFVGTGHLQLLVAKIAYAHLHQRPDARGLVQRIVHDRRMRISEALVSFAQVGMRIDMQDADAGIPPGHRPD